ncbi:MAG: amino acid adenylation domain-containing protein [Cyanobacteria bacterium J06560_6]
MSQFYQQLAALSPEQRALFEKKLAAKGLTNGLQKLNVSTIPPRPTDQPIPLSFAQQRLWFVQQLDPENTAYNVASVLKLKGALNVSALEKSLNALVERHETFRTRFELVADEQQQKQPVQVIDSPQPIQLKVENLRTNTNPQAVAEQKIKTITQTPFDFSQPLLRTALLQLDNDSHLLVLTTHHIISDRWSVMVFLREMTLLYRAFSTPHSPTPPLPALPIQYADYAVWQRQQLQGEKLKEQTDYWTNQLSGELPVLELPMDRSYGAVATYQGSQVPFAFSPELSKQLKAISSQYKVTLFTLLLTACKVLLHRYTDSDDIVVGSDIANRDRTETEDLIGLLVNTLVFRSDLSNNPRFCDLLTQVRETVLGGLAHKDLPFEKLVEVINPERHLSQMMPLFQVKLDLQQVDVKPMVLDGLTIERYPLPETQAKYELRFNVQDTPQGISGQVEYNSDLFDEKTIARLISHFQTLLSGIAESPEQQISELPLLSKEEKQTVLIDWNQTQRAYPTDSCIHQLFEAQVEKTPEAIALTNGQQSLTYAELNAQVNRVARHLQTLGIQPSSEKAQTVGICMARSCDMIVSLLAVLKAGAAYVPLDPAYPAKRLAFIAEDANILLLLTKGKQTIFDTSQPLQIVDVEDISSDLSTHNLEMGAVSNSLAYVIYTSGSTGRPKGVAIEHRSTVTLLHWAKEQFSQDELSGVLASTSICFDLSVFEIFSPLSWGGRVVLVENALAFTQLPDSARVGLVNTVPSVLGQLLKMDRLPPSVQTVNLAGEALPITLIQKLQELDHIQKIYNLYGPSEDTTYSTCAPLHAQDFTTNTRVPIGRPIANTKAYVLDRYRQPVPVGVAGELYLGGSGLARGYLNRPDLTGERFVDLNLLGFDGSTQPTKLPTPSRFYQTGDRVRRLPDGSLEFLGRLDHQVKIRGFRIELGEIETTLRQHPSVEEAVVIVQGDDNAQLIAYIVSAQSPTGVSLKETLRQHLAKQLPAYLVPTLWVELETLPQLPNGKINRRALPQPAQQEHTAFALPETQVQKALVAIWRDVLNQKKVGIYDNFFELGGHSLLAIQIVAQVETSLGCKIPLKAIFQAPTVAELATVVRLGDRSIKTDQRPPIEIDIAQRNQPFPLTDIQQAYWLGRTQAFELGNIGTHGYREIEAEGLSVMQVEKALNALIKRHDMLRAVVNADGQQQILPTVPEYKIKVTDVLDKKASAELDALRDRLSHQIFAPEQWPLFHIESAQLTDKKVRFFVSFDVLIGDAWSFQLIGKEMAQLIRGEQLPTLSLSFRDYVMAEQAFRETVAYDQALDYWQNRLETLPPAPNLPLTMAPSQVTDPRFERRSGRLEPEDWARLKRYAHEASLTPSGVVLAAFAEVLTAWSQQPQFTLNLTLFNRLPLHPEVNQIIGDFTASMLLAIDNGENDTFIHRAKRLQNQLWEDLDHRAVSGVKVLRELAKTQSNGTGALMPVVFTSTLNQSIPETKSRYWHTETVFSVSQTSQVYLDHQVSEIAGALVFNWDAIADLFPENLLDDMFAAYSQLLQQLAKDEGVWRTSPQLFSTEHVQALNQTSKVLTEGSPLLHELFFAWVEQQPEHPAVIAPDKTLSYGELATRSHALARKLKQLSVQPNQLIAVSIEKGWQQVVAVLGTLSAGAAYVPIDPALPKERRWEFIADTGAEIVLTASGHPLGWPTGLTQICIYEGIIENDESKNSESFTLERLQAPTDLAYVIYTSGSTGMPKGVMIDHQGVVNTILDINQRFEVGPSDRIFALSSLSFDLSVYDIFGTLAAGATLVMPAADQEKNPAHWRQLIVEHNVTIWNSVPALMQLLTTALEITEETTEKKVSNALRLALLSGDWIPLTLPEQIKQHCPAAQVISLGGATEASIWSIFYPIESVDPSWHSIPYGRPLANQQWYVLDENLNPCPPWVSGHLYIGGAGLAKGYWNRPELTVERFISGLRLRSALGADSSRALSGVEGQTQPTTLYRTGDLGRYLPDGTLEFLGREDFQVKVNGYRIELGEIESALQQYPAIESAVVEAVGTPPQLVAYVVPKQQKSHALSQPLAKLDFKQKQLGLRAIAPEDKTLSLPLTETPTETVTRRQSHRRFLKQPIDIALLSNLLAGLRAHTIDNAPLPKYRYASAGSLYPIQTYLHVKEGRVTGVAPGWYYYHPADHQLVSVGLAQEGSPDLYGPNEQLHQESAFTIFFVANMDAIAPIYKEKSRDFCLIETGYMGQLMMELAPDFDLGLCPIGGFEGDILRQVLELGEQYSPLHALVGGAIAPSWSQKWMAVKPLHTASIADTLKQYLEKKLPAYMVPTRYQILERLPLTANGKVDRKAMPAPLIGTETEYVAPTTPTETTITELWQTLLSVEKIGIHDNFFEVGGNSLTAMQLLSQLQNVFKAELTIAQLFGALTPAKQSELINQSTTSETLSTEQKSSATTSTASPISRRVEINTSLPNTDQSIDQSINELSEEGVDDLLKQLLAEETPEVRS